jgi:hypothetical protein
MGAVNRQFRRQQQREKMREWVRDGTAERVRKLSVNGITAEDLTAYHKKGYEEGYLYASTAFMKKMYAAIAKELMEAGNDKDEIFSFIRAVDQRFAVMFDADEEIEDVFNSIGVRMVLQPDGISTIEVK